MKPITFLVKLAFFLAVLWLAVNNTSPVEVRLSSTAALEGIPLIVVMLACLGAGVLATALALGPRLYRLRRQLAAARAAGARGTGDEARPAPRSAPPPTLNGQRLVEVARNVGAVGELDPDTRLPRH